MGGGSGNYGGPGAGAGAGGLASAGAVGTNQGTTYANASQIPVIGGAVNSIANAIGGLLGVPPAPPSLAAPPAYAAPLAQAAVSASEPLAAPGGLTPQQQAAQAAVQGGPGYAASQAQTFNESTYGQEVGASGGGGTESPGGSDFGGYGGGAGGGEFGPGGGSGEGTGGGDSGDSGGDSGGGDGGGDEGGGGGEGGGGSY